MSDKIYHYVYKITNITNNEYYIGLRSSNIEPIKDAYMGSGTRIVNSIKKHGSQNFQKQIIEIFENRELASSKEEQLVTKEILNDPLCLNLKTGGDTGVSFYMPLLKQRIGNLNPNFGNKKKKSQEQIENARQAMMASPVFQESRKSLAYRNKISDLQSREVIIFNKNFDILFSFKNCRLTAEALNVTRANISNAIRDKRMIGKRIKSLQEEYYVCYTENFQQYKEELNYNE
ncbi:hypothetical protein KAZ66_00085 [Candidatus Woesebacteria bacterium]|nr:hypothetical protein [Candidatus Woesebacteria bacterium]